MKKLLSLLLCTAILCAGAFVALAEAVGVKTLISVSGLYTLEIPEDYVLITKETVGAMIDAYGESRLEEAGLDSSVLEMMANSNAMADYVYAPDLSCNLNVQVSVKSGITSELLPLVVSQFDEALSSQYQQIGVPQENQEARGLVERGDTTFYNYYVNIGGLDIDQFMTFDAAGDMFTLTFTAFDEALEQQILSSFALAGE